MIGATAGAVAGTRFGAPQLPDRWLDSIDEVNELDGLATQLPNVGRIRENVLVRLWM